MNTPKNILTGEEVLIIQMAIESLIDTVVTTMADTSIPFNKQAKKDMRDILNNAYSALQKIKKQSGLMSMMEPYKPGDEKEFFTKES